MTTATSSMRPSPIGQSRPVAATSSGPALALASLDPVRLLRKHYPWLILASIVGAVCGAAAHFALLRVYPVFTSTATFEANSPTTDPKSPTTNFVGQDDFTRFIGTQAAIMTSAVVLEPATKDPQLEQSAWAQQFVVGGAFQPQTAQRSLLRELSARPVSQTNLIRLSFSYRDPDAARVVVDSVTRAFLDQYETSNTRQSAGRREVLNKQITELDRNIRDGNNKRDALLVAMNVTELKEGQSSSEDVKTLRLNEQLVGAYRDLSTTTTLLDRYTAMVQERIVPIAPDDIREQAGRDPVVQQLDSQIANLRVEERSMIAGGFGSDSLQVLQVRQRIQSAVGEREDVFQTQTRKIFDAELDKLRTQKSALDGQVSSLTQELEKTSKRKEDLTRLRVNVDQIQREIDRFNNERSALVSARNDMVSLNDNVFARIRLVDAARKPTEVTFPKLEILVPLGVLLLTGLVGGALVLRELLDQRVKGPADVGMIPRMRVLGMIPEASEDPVKAANLETAFRDAPTGVVSESFRQVRSPLIKSMEQGGYRTLLVLAGMPGSGATTVASNLALACAGSGERVLIIDANLRRPAMHRVFGLPDSPGVADCLAGQAMLSQAIQSTNVKNLSVLTVGSMANRMLPERLSSEAMGRLLAEASTTFDRIIVDAPPAIVSGDGLALANRVDAVALVVRALSEKRGLVNRLRLQLSETRAEFLGVIVNAVRSSAGGYFRGNIKATHEYQSTTTGGGGR